MAEEAITAPRRQRQLSVEETTTKLLFQRQNFVLYMPRVHQRHLGLSVIFPHEIVAQTVDSLDDIGQLKFNTADIDAITENIRRMHYLAVTKYDDIDPLLTLPEYQKEPPQDNKSPFERARELDAMYGRIPLTPNSSEFRLLDMIPGERGSPVVCDLFTATSLLEIDYEALSYVWGSTAELKYAITVNDCSMPVTTNLYRALQSLRYSDKKRLIWVDAVCIDQYNDTEKITQLPMMGDIYRTAKSVCVYLGEADDESDYLLHVLEEHHDPQLAIGARVQDSANWTATLDYLRTNEDRIIHALVCLMYRKWFERLWIYQEFHMASREPLIYIGSRSVSASVMFGALFGFLAEFAASPSIWTAEKLQQVSHTLSIDLVHPGTSPTEVRFSDLRRKVRHCSYAVHTNDLMPRYPCFWLADPAIAAAQCSVPEDKIYGIVGMFDPVAREILKPVKNMPREVVFMRVTAWCLLVDNQVFYTFFRYHLLLKKDYPSWTLAFDKPIPFDELPNQLKVKQEKVFPDEDPLAKICIVHQQVLYIEGIEFATIEDVCILNGTNDYERLKRLWQLEQHLACRSIGSGTQAAQEGGKQNYILHWALGFSGKLISWLTRHAIFFELILSAQFPDFPETELYPSGDAMQELLGGLLFDSERLLKELYVACELATTVSATALPADLSLPNYGRLGKALFGPDIVENAKTLRVVYDALEHLVPAVLDERLSERYLEQHGWSSTDARHNAKTLVAAIADEGGTIDEDTSYTHMHHYTYNFENLRDEYAERLLNSTFITTTNGAAGLGPEGVHGYLPGDKVVFFRQMPTALAVRRCEGDDEAYRFVGIVQMEGLLDGSIYERAEIKKSKPRLFEIR